MSGDKSQRRLSSMLLTRKHHLQYMGLWILLSVCQLVIINALGYQLLRERWDRMSTLGGGLVELDAASRAPFVLGLAVETVVFCGFIVFLAMLTAHRVAGPYIRLRNTFREVRDGNHGLVLRFRQYDRLEEVEQAFNEMMAALRGRLKDPAAK